MSIPPYDFGAWGHEPLLFAPHEAWLFSLTKGSRNKWIRINSRTAALNVSPLCELDFKRKFRSLPPLPFGAFRGTDVERKRSDPYDPEEVENRTILRPLRWRQVLRVPRQGALALLLGWAARKVAQFLIRIPAHTIRSIQIRDRLPIYRSAKLKASARGTSDSGGRPQGLSS